MTTILAIDQGTSGTKAIVVDPAGGVLATAEDPVRPAYLGAGAVEQDPGRLLSSVLASGRRALQATGRTADIMTLANQGETVLAWDPAAGAPLSQAIGVIGMRRLPWPSSPGRVFRVPWSLLSDVAPGAGDVTIGLYRSASS